MSISKAPSTVEFIYNYGYVGHIAELDDWKQHWSKRA